MEWGAENFECMLGGGGGGGGGGLWKNHDRVTRGALNFFLDVNSVILTYE